MDIKQRIGQAYGKGPVKPGAGDERDGGKPVPPPRQQAAKRPAPSQPAGRGPAGDSFVKVAAKPSPGAASAERGAGRAGARGAGAKAIAESESFLKSGRPGLEKAAKFLLLLGRDEAANVIRHLKPDEIEKVSREIARIDTIGTDEANEILTEFGWLAKTAGASLSGGPDIAESMLAAAFGEERAREVFRKAVPEARKPFAFLEEFDARQLIALLKDESPQMVAMILPYLSARLASGVVSELPAAMRSDVIQRIARLDRSPPDVVERVEAALRDKAARVGRVDSGQRIDGAEVLAGILKHVDSGLEDSILGGLEEADPELSRNIRDRLFTADDLLRVADKDMQKGLRDLSERDIAMILKGKSQAFRDKVLSNVSHAKRTMTLEEYDIMGTVRRDEVEKATKAFLAYFKRRWEDGELVLEGDEDLVD